MHLGFHPRPNVGFDSLEDLFQFPIFSLKGLFVSRAPDGPNCAMPEELPDFTSFAFEFQHDVLNVHTLSKSDCISTPNLELHMNFHFSINSKS